MWPSRITIVSVQLIIILRVLALYHGRNKIVTWFIGILYFCEVCSLLTLNIINIRNTRAIDAYDVVPGCIYHLVPESLSNNWIPPIIFEGIIIILTFYEVYPYRHDHANSTVRILARDSVVYFVFMMSIHIVNFVIWRTDAFVFGDAYATPSSVMSCIAVSHMMMNLRGLSPDIQLDTQHRHGHPDSLVIESIPMFTTSQGPDPPDIP
ncbi:hypothetical protein BD779DRAFT_959192 [Infundibulicybe gibba]|nr:hypothetical protein BD779DRAFT_959192 [Infundibulicybe gibba]